MPITTSVVLVGSGSAALTTALFLTKMGITDFIMLERRAGPLQQGQADGVQCRTVEMYEAFGLEDAVLREAFHVIEVAFWSVREDESGDREKRESRPIVRTRRAVDTEDGLSHMPHVILNQARMNGILLDEIGRLEGPGVRYGWEVKSLEVDREAAARDAGSYCVNVVVEKKGVQEVIKAKYALGCDGAHSIVRKSLGISMLGDSSDAVWGVMDVYPRTDFPDIRKKSTIHSDSGNLLIIPREGGTLVRFYIELPHGTRAKDVKLEDLQHTTREIFHPYTMEIAGTFWWSAYAIGQRLAEKFSESNRVFLTGDACHTHSPKAGQGMNVSLQDGYNLGWKLAMVLRKQCSPELLKTYNIEREKVAADLIEFDRYFMKMFSSKAKEEGITAQQFSEAFVQSGKFTAGLTSRYADSMITNAAMSKQEVAKSLIVGMRFPSRQVVRFCDAKAMQLVKALPSDGRWRLVVFAGDIREAAVAGRLNKFAQWFTSKIGSLPNDILTRIESDGLIEPILVLSSPRLSIEQEQIPGCFWPVTGIWKSRDLHKVYNDDESYHSGHGKAYESYGIDPSTGAVALVRPDQYISMVTDLVNVQEIENVVKGFALHRT